jgi:hypothetical protein
MEQFDASVKNLLKVIGQIQNAASGGGLDFMKTSSKPYWHLCVEKFHAAYLKAKNPEGFTDMFSSFFEKHEDKFTSDVIDEDGDINDEWLKNKEVLTKSSKKKKSDDLSFSLRNINCRGEVIYFDESNEKIRNVSIPISEAYLAACKIYSDGAKNGEYSPLPAQLLMSLFSVMQEVCDDEHKKKLKSNVKALKEVVDQLTNGEEDNKTTGATLEPIGNLMNTFAKKFGLGGKDGFDMSNIEKTVGSIFSDDVTGKVKDVWNSFNEKVNVKDGADLGSIISNVSEVMKDGSIQAKLSEAVSTVAAKVGLGEIKISAEDQEKIAPSGAAVDEQE